MSLVLRRSKYVRKIKNAASVAKTLMGQKLKSTKIELLSTQTSNQIFSNLDN